MGGGTSKGFWADPMRQIIKDTAGEKASKVFAMTAPLDPLTQKYYTKGIEKLDQPQREAEEEAKRQDELMKKLALGENPMLGETDTY